MADSGITTDPLACVIIKVRMPDYAPFEPTEFAPVRTSEDLFPTYSFDWDAAPVDQAADVPADEPDQPGAPIVYEDFSFVDEAETWQPDPGFTFGSMETDIVVDAIQPNGKAIFEFASGQNRIMISGALTPGLQPGQLDELPKWTTTEDPTIVYANGNLIYDANGSAQGGEVVLANLGLVPLAAADVFVV